MQRDHCKKAVKRLVYSFLGDSALSSIIKGVSEHEDFEEKFEEIFGTSL